ncbi:LAMI_0D12882g1_1 [Lachancea mirantina]|uniref:LAMI_0D12882g1_1 n=1 Tax=Lachancea mirantina TaxID=1230905 RepID=A0A1G4JGE7_9SACH|nr:LAMI_0D12882g1_1 [Lachancea mirantina]
MSSPLAWDSPAATAKTFFGLIAVLLAFKFVNLASLLFRCGYLVLFTTGSVEFLFRLVFQRPLLGQIDIDGNSEWLEKLKKHTDAALGRYERLNIAAELNQFISSPAATLTSVVILYFASWCSSKGSGFAALVVLTTSVFAIPFIYEAFGPEINALQNQLVLQARAGRNHVTSVLSRNPRIKKLMGRLEAPASKADAAQDQKLRSTESDAEGEGSKGSVVHVKPIMALDVIAPPPEYDPPFRDRILGNSRRRVGDVFNFTKFGVNVTTIVPGKMSSLRHYHTEEDEFVYVVAGHPTLVTDDGESELSPSMCVGFKAGSPNAHHILNKTNEPVLIIEIGDRPKNDKVYYPYDDVQ